MEQGLITLSEHIIQPPVTNGVRVAQSVVFYVMFCRSLFETRLTYSLICLLA
jgi:hypothetical protein